MSLKSFNISHLLTNFSKIFPKMKVTFSNWILVKNQQSIWLWPCANSQCMSPKLMNRFLSWIFFDQRLFVEPVVPNRRSQSVERFITGWNFYSYSLKYMPFNQTIFCQYYSVFRDIIISKQAQLVLCAAKAFNARLLDAQTFNTSDLLSLKVC